MKIGDLYDKTILDEFWTQLGETSTIAEAESLNDLLSQSHELVFKTFNISPDSKDYVIVGSARLYLYPNVREAFNLQSSIGDLDFVIPNKQLWIDAGLEDYWNNGGIYRPTEDGSIEVFNIWDPSKAGGAYADVKVRSTQDIMNDSTMINGYNYMSMGDIFDYKIAMNRTKEQDVVALVKAYQKSKSNNGNELLRRISKIIGLDKTKEFLGNLGK